MQYSDFDMLALRAGQKYSHVVSEIEQFLEQISPCPKEPSLGTGWCEFVSAEFFPKEASGKSDGQRILVIDHGMHLAAYTRYRSRVLDSLAPDKHGIYRSVQEKVELPRGELEILSHILGERYPETPAIALEKIKRRENKEKSIFNAMTYGPRHGDIIFGTLADLNPDAEFVIAELWMVSKRDICSNNSTMGVLEALGSYADNLAESLIQTIKKHNINFVNMSFGQTTKEIAKELSACTNSEVISQNFYRRVLKLFKERFYDQIFALKDIVFVQAAPWSSWRLQEDDPDYLIDCTHYPNRVRVGFIEKLATDVPPEGAKRDRYIEHLAAKECIDVFFNSGVEMDSNYDPVLGEFPYLSTMYGMGTTRVSFPFCTSWATPFVLSYLNFKKQEAKANGEDFNFSHLIQSHIILEPVKYRQLEVFRTGILQ